MTKITLTKKLYNSSKNIWDKYYKHPFIEGMFNGTLDRDKFRFYLIQDYIYLLDYSKVFALGIVKSSNEEIMKKLAFIINNILNSEMTIHNKYKDKLNITNEEIKNTKASIHNISYTKYMIEIGYSGDILDILVAVLACSWSYKEIGENLAKSPYYLKSNFYYNWIEGYSKDKFKKDNDELIEFIDKLGENCTDEKYKKLEEIFINCSRYEYNFWDMSYKKEF